jgi:protein-tyrosine phosphatase
MSSGDQSATRTAHARPRILAGLLLAAVVAWLGVLAVGWIFRERPNYTRIEEGLYVGGLVSLPPRGARVVLNLCEQEDAYRADVHRWEPIADAAPAPSLDWLRKQVGFIETHRNSDATVYVHCRNGVSRSGMVAVAYLMKKDGLSRDAALTTIRAKRPEIRPNPAFMELLLAWERELTSG